MNQTTIRQMPANICNGVDVDTLMGTINAIKGDAALGACRFRAS